MTDTTRQLRETARHIRELAENAANDAPGDQLCCWNFERIAGHERVIEVRAGKDGTSQEIVALPAGPQVAPHIAAWDPTCTMAVARLLDAVVDTDPRQQGADLVWLAALAFSRLLGDGREHTDQAAAEETP